MKFPIHVREFFIIPTEKYKQQKSINNFMGLVCEQFEILQNAIVGILIV